MITTTLGGYIRDRRTALRLSQTDLAEASGLSSGHLSQIESGKIKWPDADKRRRLAAALGVSHLDLLIAAGELLPEEVVAAGKVGVIEERADDLSVALVERLRNARLDAGQVEAIESMMKTWGT